MHENTKRRIQAVKKLAAKHYEEGNLAKCHKSVWRRFILPVYGIGYRTYLSYLKTAALFQSRNRANLAVEQFSSAIIA